MTKLEQKVESKGIFNFFKLINEVLKIIALHFFFSCYRFGEGLNIFFFLSFPSFHTYLFVSSPFSLFCGHFSEHQQILQKVGRGREKRSISQYYDFTGLHGTK